MLFISTFCLELSAAAAKGEVNSIGFDDALGIALSQKGALKGWIQRLVLRKLVLKDETIPSEDIIISSMDDLVSDVISQSYQIISIKRDIQLDNPNDMVTLNRLKYDSALKSLEEARMRLGMGLIPENAYNLSKQQADDALCTYMQPRLDYYVKVKS